MALMRIAFPMSPNPSQVSQTRMALGQLARFKVSQGVVFGTL
jgi:hypothetical protein